MSVEMKAVKPLKYKTRHLKPGKHFNVKNEREARVLQALKKAERTDNANVKVALDDARVKVGLPAISKDSEAIAVVRQQYYDKFGRRPFNGWDIPTLKAKIAE